MREATPPPTPTPVQPSAPRSLDKAISDGWSFCTDNLAATSVPAWLISLPGFLIIIFYNEKIGDGIGQLLGLIATMGTIRMVFLSASIGEKPTVMGGFIEGFSFFGRGILASIILVVSLGLVLAALAAVLAPALVLRDAGHEAGAIVYLVVWSIPAIWVFMFCSLRLSLTITAAADADKSIGEAFGCGLRYTKGRTSELFWISFQLGLIAAILIFVFIFAYQLLAEILGRSLPTIPAVATLYILSWPIHVLTGWYVATLAKVYLALKPQPPADNKPGRVKLTLDSVR